MEIFPPPSTHIGRYCSTAERGTFGTMATQTEEASASTASQVRIHLKSRTEDVQIPDSGTILVSTGMLNPLHHPRTSQTADAGDTAPCTTAAAFPKRFCAKSADLNQNFEDINSPRWSIVFWKPTSPSRSNSSSTANSFAPRSTISSLAMASPLRQRSTSNTSKP